MYPQSGKSAKKPSRTKKPSRSEEIEQKEIEQEEIEQEEIQYFLDRYSEFSKANCSEVLDFIHRLYSQKWDTTNEKRGRALIAVLCISNRINGMCKTRTARLLTVSEETVKLIGQACSQWSSVKEMKSTVLGMHQLLKSVVADALCCDPKDLLSLNGNDLVNRLQKCGKLGNT
jgi:hypothetical protein